MINRKRVIGICGIVSPAPYANALCLENVFKELSHSGYECHVLGVGETKNDFVKNGISYHVIQHPTQNQNSLKRLYSALHLTSLPQTEPHVTKVKYDRLKELHEEYCFDCAIGVCASYANVYAALQLKQNYPNVRAIGYYLDSIESLSRLSGYTRTVRDYFSYKGEEKVFRELDGIVLPVASSRIYDDSRYENTSICGISYIYSQNK